MQSWDWIFSIRTKLVAAISLLIALISIFIYLFFPARLERQAMAATVEKANSLATMMAYNISPALVSDDRPTVCDVVISAKHTRDIDYVMVLDESGNVIATFDSSLAQRLSYVDADFAEKISPNGQTFQTVAAIISHGQYLGRVYLGFSLNSLNAEVSESRKNIAGLSFLVCSLGILLAVAMSTLLTKRLLAIVETEEKIAAGDWSQRVAISSKDELTRVAVVFNAMVDKLQEAADDLRRNETNYREMFKANPHAMWVHDLDTLNIVDVNDIAVLRYGYSRTEFLSMTIRELCLNEDLVQFDQTVMLRGGESNSEENWRHKKKNGSVIDVELTSRSLPVRDGRKLRLALAHDITKRKEGERELKASEERYRDLFENASDLIQLFGADLKFQFVNRSWLETLGYSTDEVAGLSVLDILRPDEQSRFEGFVAEVLSGKTLRHVQIVIIAKEGNEVVVEGNLSGRVENGNVVAIRGMFRDITERRRAEVAILLQKARFEQLFENAPVGIVLTDTSSKIVNANKEFEKMFGYTIDELSGKTILETIISPEQENEASILLEKTFSGIAIERETIRRRKNGSPIHVGLYSVPLQVHGQSHGLFGMYMNITDRKLAEAKQAQLMHELEATNKELNDFAYIISHDLKAPLRGIGSLVDWLTSDYGDKLGDEGNKMMKILLGRTKRMHELIDGVLKYSRIGRVKERTEDVPLDTLVPEIVELISPPENIEINIQRPLPVIKAEGTRMQQVFQNLLSNAVKFMDKPQGRVDIDCVRENGHWKFSVGDNGPGIDERYHDKIFQIFQTLSPRDTFESTGIGLTIVKKIIETYGGRIWLESKVGEGAKFIFTLPANTSERTQKRR